MDFITKGELTDSIPGHHADEIATYFGTITVV
jgi:hypothetical protein